MCGDVPGAWAGTGKVQYTTPGVTTPCPSPPPPPPEAPSAKTALLMLKTAAGARWPTAGIAGWTSATDPCAGPWSGVTCTGGGAVAAVDLSFYTLQGALPDGLADLGSQLTSLQLAGSGCAALRLRPDPNQLPARPCLPSFGARVGACPRARAADRIQNRSLLFVINLGRPPLRVLYCIPVQAGCTRL